MLFDIGHSALILDILCWNIMFALSDNFFSALLVHTRRWFTLEVNDSQNAVKHIEDW